MAEKEYSDNAHVRTTTRAREWEEPDRDAMPRKWDIEGMPRDEMIPERGRRMPRHEPDDKGDQEDTAGQHGRMAPEAAEALEAMHENEQEE